MRLPVDCELLNLGLDFVRAARAGDVGTAADLTVDESVVEAYVKSDVYRQLGY
jgi:hypothetical protein